MLSTLVAGVASPAVAHGVGAFYPFALFPLGRYLGGVACFQREASARPVRKLAGCSGEQKAGAAVSASSRERLRREVLHIVRASWGCSFTATATT